jgi:hypothetical protein
LASYDLVMRTVHFSLPHIVTAFMTLIALAACQSAPPVRPPTPELQLLEASPLQIPRDCIAAGSYVVSFRVATSGRTAAIRAPDAPACVEQALSAWVESFRYAPPARVTPATIEWMMVTAKRGS